MQENSSVNYYRIAEAIEYIKVHFKEQPSLDEVAQKVHLSPFHFQKLFSEWAGTSPKKFLQYTTLEYAKSMLREQQATLFDTAQSSGLSGTGRLHDLFVQIEGMTPAEYKNGAQNLSIYYSFTESPFGKIIIASTSKGICFLAFYEEEENAISILRGHFPQAQFSEKTDIIQLNALKIFNGNPSQPEKIKLHLKGTAFQLKVWEALLKIPMGKLSTYGTVAQTIENPQASRAVGTAIGNNPVAYIIPCHRVIQASGILGGYMWGNTRKTAIIAWEGTKTHEIV